MIGSMMRRAMIGDGSTLNVDFTSMTNGGQLANAGFTFTNATTTARTYINSSGLVATATTNEPRFDYTGGTARGLLIEGTATNLVTQSNGSTSVWGTGANRTPTNNTTDLVSPDGTNNATKLVCGSAGAYASFATSISGLTGGATYTISYWIRGPVGHSPRLYAQNGTIGDVTATATTGTYNNTGWTRLTQTYTLPAATTQCLVYFMSTNIVTTGETFYVYGFQMETGSFASSHIPTGASTVTRLADECSMTGTNFSSWYNQSEGTFVADFQTVFTNAAAQPTCFILAMDGSTNKRLMYFAGSAQINSFDGATIITVPGLVGVRCKAASAYSATGRALCANGGIVSTGAVAAGYSTSTSLNIGLSGNGNSLYRRVAYWPTRLSNAQLQSLTT